MFYHKITLTIALLFSSTLLGAVELNDVDTIIEEASLATTELQTEFAELIEEEENETTLMEQEQNMSMVGGAIAEEVIEIQEINLTETVDEVIETPELNLTSSIEEIVVIQETNLTEPIEETIEETIDETIEIVETNLTDSIEIQKDKNSTEESEEENEGSMEKGLVIFKTRLKVPCGMTGEEFAKNYTQEDWEDIYEGKEFEKAVVEICPKMEGKYKERWTSHLFQFSVEYASDSDNIPEC